jgi:hypothetical protein
LEGWKKTVKNNAQTKYGRNRNKNTKAPTRTLLHWGKDIHSSFFFITIRKQSITAIIPMSIIHINPIKNKYSDSKRPIPHKASKQIPLRILPIHRCPNPGIKNDKIPKNTNFKNTFTLI